MEQGNNTLPDAEDWTKISKVKLPPYFNIVLCFTPISLYAIYTMGAIDWFLKQGSIMFFIITYIKVLPRIMEIIKRPQISTYEAALKEVFDLRAVVPLYCISFVISCINYKYMGSVILNGAQFGLCFFILKILKVDDNCYDKRQQILSSDGLDYGSGMSQNFYEGYLRFMLPCIGKDTPGIKSQIELYEDQHRVEIAVKKLFLLIPRSLKAPNLLNYFNPDDKKGVCAEACQSLDHVVLNRSAVMNRVYKHTVYRLFNGEYDTTYAHIVAECATPLLTYNDLMQKIGEDNYYSKCKDQIIIQFIQSLQKILKDRQCEDLCEIVYYDDLNYNVNILEILRNRVRKLRDNANIGHMHDNY